MNHKLIALATLTLISTLPAFAQSLYQGAGANQLRGVNANGTAPEAKSIVQSGLATVTHTVGTITVGASHVSGVSTKSASFTAAAGQLYVVSAVSTATLPDATLCANQMVVIKNTSGGSVTMASTNSQLIDGAAAGSTTVATVTSKRFISDGTNWISL